MKYKLTRFIPGPQSETKLPLLNGWRVAKVLAELHVDGDNIINALVHGWDNWSPDLHHGDRSYKHGAAFLRDGTYFSIEKVPTPKTRFNFLEIGVA